MTATEILAIIGAAALMSIVAVVIVIAKYEMEKLIKNKKREYQVNHRFDKPPKAKCYCVDCVHYDPIDSRTGLCCLSNGKAFTDDHFCAMAEPTKNSRR